MYPSLVNCTTIDLFADWPQDALLEVGERYLAQIDLAGDDKVSDPPFLSSIDLSTFFFVRYSVSDGKRIATHRLSLPSLSLFVTCHIDVQLCFIRSAQNSFREKFRHPAHRTSLVSLSTVHSLLKSSPPCTVRSFNVPFKCGMKCDEEIMLHRVTFSN